MVAAVAGQDEPDLQQPSPGNNGVLLTAGGYGPVTPAPAVPASASAYVVAPATGPQSYPSASVNTVSKKQV